MDIRFYLLIAYFLFFSTLWQMVFANDLSPLNIAQLKSGDKTLLVGRIAD